MGVLAGAPFFCACFYLTGCVDYAPTVSVREPVETFSGCWLLRGRAVRPSCFGLAVRSELGEASARAEAKRFDLLWFSLGRVWNHE